MSQVKVTTVDNICVFPVERTHLRKHLENDAWNYANKTDDKARSGPRIARVYSHVPREIMDAEYKRVTIFLRARVRHYRRIIRADSPATG